MSLPLTDPIATFAVLLLILLLSPLLAARLRLPPLVILIVVGCVCGSNVLGLLARDPQLIFLEKIGLLYIMFLAGLQMDLSNLQRLGVRSLLFGLLTFALPFATGMASALVIGPSWLTAALLGVLYSPHVLIAYPSMTRLGLAQRESIGVAVGGTVVTAILTLVGFALIQAVAQGQVSGWLWVKLLILLPIFAGFCGWSLPKLGQPLLNPSEHSLSLAFVFVLAVLFVCATVTQLLGVDAVVGAFIAGLALNRSIPTTSALMQQIDFVGNSLFIPAFMVSVGVLANPQLLADPNNLGMALFVIAGAMGAKLVAAAIAGRTFDYGWTETMTLFSLTCSRAALVLIFALFGQDAGLIKAGLFNAIIAYMMVTCLLGPLLAEVCGQRLVAQTHRDPASTQP